MPIEIKQLVIRAVAEAGAGQESSASGEEGEANTEAIVRECVRQVLAILEREKER